MFDLTPDQIADAEAAGVSFPAASPDQVQRYAMQQKVFRIDGAPHLATRDGALFETAGTLDRLIAEGERQRRDLAGWEATAPAPAVEAPAPPVPSSVPSAESPAAADLAPLPVAKVAEAPRQRRTPRAERWLTAGAERRGRRAQHWSVRGGR
jgi:hypothetical protein